MNGPIVIKSISTNQYEIGIFELPNGEYCVALSTPAADKACASVFSDWTLASSFFDIKLSQLEAA